jgi:UTP-glucose-1-phosphate uridylyltransferase
VLNLTDTVEKPSVEYAREHLRVPGTIILYTC